MGSEGRTPIQPSAITWRLIDGAIKDLMKKLPPETCVTHLQAHIGQQLEKLFKTYPTPDHPPYALMIRQAIEELNEDGGSDEEAISKIIKLKYQSLPWGHTSLLSHHLKKLSKEGEIVCLSGDRYMLPSEECDAISKVKQQKKRKRKNCYKERSAQQRKLSKNHIAQSSEKHAQVNEAKREQVFVELEHGKMKSADQAFKKISLLVEVERKEGEQDEEAVEDVKEGHCQHSELAARAHSEEEENDAANIQALEQEEGQQGEEAIEGEIQEGQLFVELEQDKMKAADHALKKNSLLVEGERKEGQQGEEAVEDVKEGHCQHSELASRTHSEEEENHAANIQALEQEEGQQGEEAVEGESKEGQQGEGAVEELKEGHCKHSELVAQTHLEDENDVANIQAQGQNHEDEDLKNTMVEKKIEKLETEIEGIEKLIESQRQQEDAIKNRSRQHEKQAQKGSEIADNRTLEEESVLASSLILSPTCQHLRDVGSSISSENKCLELLKRTEGIRKCLYKILESIGPRERSANTGESIMLGNEPIMPVVPKELHLARSTLPSQEQQQESTFIKEGKQLNFEIGEQQSSEIFAQVTNAEGLEHQKRLLTHQQLFETETNAISISIVESMPLINCKKTEQQRNLLTQGQNKQFNSGENVMHTSNAVSLPENWKNRSNGRYPFPTEAATSTLFSDIQRKVISQDTTQKQLQLLSEIHKPPSSNVELPHEHQHLMQQLSGFSGIDGPLMKPPALAGEKLKPLDSVELEKLIDGQESKSYKTKLRSRAIVFPPKPGPNSERKGIVIGQSQCEHREEKKAARRGRPPKLKSKTVEESSSFSQKRFGRPLKPKPGVGEESPLSQKRRGRRPNSKPR